jgi:acetyl-CoA carboxylase biotin carboxylase subunit
MRDPNFKAGNFTTKFMETFDLTEYPDEEEA